MASQPAPQAPEGPVESCPVAASGGRLRFLAQPGASPWGAIFASISAAAGVVVGWLRLDHLPVTLCTLKAMTGIPCFSCGGTRAVARLAALDLAGALAMNPLVTLAALGLAVWGLADLMLLPWGRALRVELARGVARWLRIGLVAAAVLNWVFLVLAGR